MGKGIGADNSFVGLHRKSGNTGNQSRCRNNMLGIYTGFNRENIPTRAHGHNQFFKGGVTGTLTETINRTFNLSRTVLHSGQAIGYGKT